MKLVELYEYIEKEMRKDGKSSAFIEAAITEHYGRDEDKAKAIADCINPKYLPQGFDKYPVVDHSDSKYVLICIDLYDYRLMYVNTYNEWYQAYSEMDRQYKLVANAEGEGNIMRTRADYYEERHDINLIWEIYSTNTRIKSETFDKVFTPKKEESK